MSDKLWLDHFEARYEALKSKYAEDRATGEVRAWSEACAYADQAVADHDSTLIDAAVDAAKEG